jgi:hypothetical protein
MKNDTVTGLRIVLILAGLVIIFTGVNTAFGGMLTLGWQGQTTFGKDIVGSLVAELVGMPLLYFWLSRTVEKPVE